MPLLFALTLCLSAALLFLIQPLLAKMILPLLGGAPAVWLTCMLFFQAALLAGYLYAHGLASRLSITRQTLVHLTVLTVPLAALPLVSLPYHLASDTVPLLGAPLRAWLGEPPTAGTPIPWLLGLLVVSAGLPFWAVSASAPLLQKWFAGTGHAAAGDPYFLYIASNAGSMAALLGYPLLVEPLLGLLPQSWLWMAGYVVLLGLVAACALATRGAGQDRREGLTKPRRGKSASPTGYHDNPVGETLLSRPPELGIWRRLHWLALSFVPSSLLFGVTTYLSTDIAAVPLLWIAPLTLYLLTFILAFARRQLLPHRLVGGVLPALLIGQLFVLFILLHSVHLSLSMLIALHLLTFFSAALLCHGELAADRPAPEHLTEFYLWLSVGGVLGGLFNALLAPVLFTTIVEYPLVLLAACLAGPKRTATSSNVSTPPEKSARSKPATRVTSSTADLLGLLSPPALGVVASLIMVYVQFEVSGFGWPKGSVLLGLPLACYAAAWIFGTRPLWFGIPLAVMLLTAVAGLTAHGSLLYGERGFYGVLRVTITRVEERQEEFIQLFHGSTLHGKQRRTEEVEKRRQPLTYYHPDGPIGQVFGEFSGSRAKKQVGIVGLGTGSLASYGEPGQEFTFYEIDPAIVRLAQDSGYFSFLRECRASHQIVLGDARQSLKHASDEQFGLLVIDAFSSDAIPVHLLTREACADVYLRKLTPDGVLALHISNRYLDLRPVLGNLAQALRLVGRVRWDERGDDATGRSPSAWVVLARKEADLSQLATDPRWQPLPTASGQAVWTDDYSNMLHVLKW